MAVIPDFTQIDLAVEPAVDLDGWGRSLVEETGKAADALVWETPEGISGGRMMAFHAAPADREFHDLSTCLTVYHRTCGVGGSRIGFHVHPRPVFH